MTALLMDITRNTVSVCLIYIELYTIKSFLCKKNIRLLILMYLHNVIEWPTNSTITKYINDSSLALTAGKKLYDHLKSIGETGDTLSKVNDFLKSLEVNQVFKKGEVKFHLLHVNHYNNFKLIWFICPRVGLIMDIKLFCLCRYIQ